MSDYNDPCEHCGAYAMEIPDEDGDTWCAMCGEPAGESPECEESLDGSDEKSNYRRAHSLQVASRSERPLAQQASERIAGASSSTRRAYDDSEGGW